VINAGCMLAEKTGKCVGMDIAGGDVMRCRVGEASSS
jgi:hypothetical protein